MEELVVKDLNGKNVKVEKLIANIASTEAKVQKAMTSYKSVMGDIYVLYKSKVYKKSGFANFYDYLYEMTGMSKSTAAKLIKAYRTRLDVMDTLKIECDMTEEEEKEINEFFDNASMRTYAEMSADDSVVLGEINEWLQNKDKNLNESVPEAYKKDDAIDLKEVPVSDNSKKKEVLYTGEFCDKAGTIINENIANGESIFVKIWRE